MHDMCMATKTISIELDVYDKLKSAKQHPSESFSQVLRRARWGESVLSGELLLNIIEEREKKHQLLDRSALNALDSAQKLDAPPQNKWS